uniref:BTB domain-containing protein n=1 Tax=Arcella intermedia TaxID=1963864 RepID=A0A6B2LIQ3_9EUKA
MHFSLNIPRNNPFADLTLRVGDTSYPCNAIILSSVSEVFKSMLDQKWNPQREIALVEEDFAAPHFSVFLDFIYNCDCKVTSENVIALVVLSHKYSVLPLLNHLLTTLIEMVTLDSLASMYAVAKKYDLKKVTEEIISFSVAHFEYLNFDYDEINDDFYWEMVFKSDNLEIKNEISVFQKLEMMVENGLPDGTLKKLIKLISLFYFLLSLLIH